MRMVVVFAGACALLAVGAADALAKGPGGPHGNAHGMTRGLNRADAVAGPHGIRGRDIARTRGSHAYGFCPPGQKRKPGLGSRFRC